MNATYTAHYENNMMLIEPTPHIALTALLDKIGLQKITFQYGIRLQETPETKRRDVLYIALTRLGYTACIQVEDDKIMRPLSRLTDAECMSIVKRLKVDYKIK